MAGTMSEEDLVSDLKASLFDSAKTLADEDDAQFKRFLRQSLPDMEAKRPRTRLGTFELVADQERYQVAETDFAAFKLDLWRDPQKMPKPWEPCFPGPLPRILCPQQEEGAWYIAFDPAPTQRQISVLGTTFKFYYFAHHVIGALAADTTIDPVDRGLLLLRAQAEAMLAIAMRNAAKPVPCATACQALRATARPRRCTRC
jgi:hypothetical protein